jgi:hypothetical protein
MTCPVLDLLYQTHPYVLQHNELSHWMVEILRSEKDHLKDTVQIMNSMFRLAPMFTNVFVMHKKFSRLVRDSGDERRIENWKEIQELLPNA